MHCLREPAMALGSLLSVALSSTAGKQFHFTISGGFFYPLKFKIVLDMGYTSNLCIAADVLCGFALKNRKKA